MSNKARYTITPVPTEGVDIPTGPSAIQVAHDIVDTVLGGVTYVRELTAGIVLNGEVVTAVVPQVVNVSFVRSDEDDAINQVAEELQTVLPVPIYIEIDHVLDSFLKVAPV